MWDRIAAELEGAPPRMRIKVDPQGGGAVLPFERPVPKAPPVPARRYGRVQVALLGAAAVLILFLGGLVVRLNNRIGNLEDERTGTEVVAFSDPSSRRGTLELHGGEVRVPAAITTDGTGYLLAESTRSCPTTSCTSCGG